MLQNGHRRFQYVAERMEALDTKTMLMNHLLISKSPAELITKDPAIVRHMLKDNVDNYIKTFPDGDELFYNFKTFLGATRWL